MAEIHRWTMYYIIRIIKHLPTFKGPRNTIINKSHTKRSHSDMNLVSIKRTHRRLLFHYNGFYKSIRPNVFQNKSYLGLLKCKTVLTSYNFEFLIYPDVAGDKFKC